MKEDARGRLAALLRDFVPADDPERQDLEAMQRWLFTLAEPFSRREPCAHFTASAVVLDDAGGRVCLVHHRKLGRWLQPGGHLEPEDGGDVMQAALREAREETGLGLVLHPKVRAPLDVDIHTIPARQNEPTHLHLDVRFLVVTNRPDALRHHPGESHDARWFSFDEALALADEPALRRLLEKARHPR